ncbi:aspartic peptidase domain-containing protein [Aspergillus karnatakaensis]|uniref:aspartic peptidase domain-containing protein n=1 Tax=Aspergillus karnatakaensis TaxID=1810916 RepID=UPI003CCDC4EB
MRRLVCFLAFFLAAVPSIADQGIPLVRRSDPKVVFANLQTTKTPALQTRDAIPASAWNDEIGFWINVSVGTPAQEIGMRIDFTYDHIDVLYSAFDRDPDAKCAEYRYCANYGYLEFRNSSTFMTTSSEGLHENYYQPGMDTLSLGGVEARNVSLRFWRIGGDYSENLLGVSPQNTSLPFNLVDRGLINTPSFSIWSEQGVDSTKGGILFGGINAAKFTGPLQAFSFSDNHDDITVPVNGLTLTLDNTPGDTTNTNASETPLNLTLPSTPFNIDLRLVVTHLPPGLITALYDALEISADRNEDASGRHLPAIDCARHSEKHNITVSIGSTAFDVPFFAFIIDDQFAEVPSSSACRPTLAPSPEKLGWAGQLGSPILQRLYLAVDYNSKMVGLAPLKSAEEVGDDEILEIGTWAPQFPGGEGEFPESVSAYVSPTETVATETSDGWAAMKTAAAGGGGYLLSGLAGVAVFALCLMSPIVEMDYRACYRMSTEGNEWVSAAGAELCRCSRIVPLQSNSLCSNPVPYNRLITASSI